MGTLQIQRLRDGIEAELRLLISEWLKQIPEFELASDFTPALKRGKRVDTLAGLPLIWDTQPGLVDPKNPGAIA
jgi:hypothetical protein